MNFRHLAGTWALATLCLTAPAHAELVVYSQPSSLGVGARNSSTLNFVGGSPGNSTVDDFTLASSTPITGINWWGVSNGGGNSFTFTFFANNSGVPGTVLGTGTGTFSETVINPSLSSYSADLSTPFNAAGGTTYWLLIFNAAPDAAWAWGDAAPDGNGSLQALNVEPVSWGAFPVDRAFELTTDVAEPATLALLGTGLLGLGFARRRKTA